MQNREMLVKLDHFHTTGGVGSINTAMSSVSSSKAEVRAGI